MSEDISYRRLKTDIGGMLTPAVYREITTVAGTAGGPIVEIGTSTGAATIALAWGAPPGVVVYSTDSWDDATYRDRIGSPEECHRHVLANFEKYGVNQKITLLRGKSYDVVSRLDLTNGIGLLLVDADGAVDREFALFFDHLRPGAPIIIDDYDNHARFVVNSSRQSRIDQKHRLTYLLVNWFEQHGFIEHDKTIKQTWFGRKAELSPSIKEAPTEEILQVYRQLTFARGSIEFGLVLRTINWLKFRKPRLYGFLWRMREAARG